MRKLASRAPCAWLGYPPFCGAAKNVEQMKTISNEATSESAKRNRQLRIGRKMYEAMEYISTADAIKRPTVDKETGPNACECQSNEPVEGSITGRSTSIRK
ncbi:hypothetical protein RSSM_04250 [Rhodopirellula sallentina SM41]|uniref:Uncharacterized protein n=1 Tax=Rhodopirellula sallentina SM41 TaxID=1263870 RepID=M5TYM3_9BACT|nr:hypothetical protein RSSM_04250 [Rhodopirellula sallentina SM41]